MIEAERRIRGYLQSRNGNPGEIRLILDAVVELAGTDPLAYESLRKKIANCCNIRVSVLDSEVLPRKNNGSGAGLIFVDIEPFSHPVDGETLLYEISKWLSRYVVLPDGAADAIACWVLATWFTRSLYFAPILAILSPTKRAGKTLLLDLLAHVVFRPQVTSGMGVTPAVMFRLNDRWTPTFLIDEAEKLASVKESAALIGFLNVGQRRGGQVQRCEGDDHHIVSFDAFGFRALAAIGRLWGTLIDRSITVHLQRKSATETIERFHFRKIKNEGKVIARKIARWARDHRGEITEAEAAAPRPEWMNDRSCDNWSPLFAVAKVAGEDWMKTLLRSAKALEVGKVDQDLGEELIRDIHDIFCQLRYPRVISSGELATKLRSIETSPWAEYGGSGLTAQKLARLLKPFGIEPSHHRPKNGGDVRGYWLAKLQDAFSRYLPQRKPSQVSHCLESSTCNDSKLTEDLPLVPLSD